MYLVLLDSTYQKPKCYNKQSIVCMCVGVGLGVCLSLCVSVCIAKSKVVVKEVIG